MMGDPKTPEIGGLAGMGDKLKAMFGEQGPTAPAAVAPAPEAPVVPRGDGGPGVEPPEALPPAPEPAAPVPVETEEQRLERLGNEVEFTAAAGGGGEIRFGERKYSIVSWERLAETLGTFQKRLNQGEDPNFLPAGFNRERLEYALGRLNDEMRASKATEVSAAPPPPVEEPMPEGAARAVEAPVATVAAASPVEAPRKAEIPFYMKVGQARQMAARAAEEVGQLPTRLAEARESAKERRQTLPERLAAGAAEMTAEEIATLTEAREILSRYGMVSLDADLINTAIGRHERYQRRQQAAEAALDKYGKILAAAAKELKPGWFEKEPAVAREMAELQEFFDRTGDVEELGRTITEIENEKKSRAWKKGRMTAEYKRGEEAELFQANAELAMLKSGDKFMTRTDMPKILKAVIEAVRAGNQLDFGTGPVANFRKKVYESVIAELGVEAVAPAVAPAPGPEPTPTPAAVETEAEKRKTAEREFFGDTRIPEADEMSDGQKRMVEGIRDKKRGAAQAAAGLVQRAEADPDQKEDLLTAAKQTVGMVLRAAEAEKDPKKRKQMIGWTKEFVGALEATSLAGGLSGQALDGLIGLIVAQLSGK